MDVLEKRVQDRIALEARQLRAEQMKLGKRKQALVREAQRGQAAVTKLFAALEGEKSPTKQVTEAGTTAFKTLAKVARQMVSVNEQLAENSSMLATLENPKERERRVAEAKEFGVAEKPLSGLEAAEMVLIKRGRATHVTDLTRTALASGVVRLTGKTPEQTMSAYLAKAVGRPDSRFVRVAPGVFDLRDRPEPAKPKPRRPKPKPEEVVEVV